jgi:hypothetical protein
MLADDIADRLAAACPNEIDGIVKDMWGKRADGLLADNEVEVLDEAARARREAFQERQAEIRPAPSDAPQASARRPRALRLQIPRPPRRPREKLFGVGRPVPLDREAKNRIMVLMRALKRPTGKGKHYGAITAKAEDVGRVLLWVFHNARTGLCFPSYEAIAEAAHCHRDTVAEAIGMLEAARILTWCNRRARVRINGVRKVIRTSNSYCFRDPGSKSEIPSGTKNQEILSPVKTAGILPQGRQEGIRTRLGGANPSQDRKKRLGEEARDSS